MNIEELDKHFLKKVDIPAVEKCVDDYLTIGCQIGGDKGLAICLVISYESRHYIKDWYAEFIKKYMYRFVATFCEPPYETHLEEFSLKSIIQDLLAKYILYKLYLHLYDEEISLQSFLLEVSYYYNRVGERYLNDDYCEDAVNVLDNQKHSLDSIMEFYKQEFIIEYNLKKGCIKSNE